MTALLDHFAAQLKATIQSPDADAIHDLRVAIRRFSQAIATFSSRLEPTQVRAIRSELKTILESAGMVRDCDIALDLLSKPGLSNVNGLQDGLQARRQTTARLMLVALRRWIARRRASQWRRQIAAAAVGKQMFDEIARQELPKLAKSFFRKGTRVDAKISAGDLHKVRISVKKLRYTLELLQSAYGPVAEGRLEQLREVQSTLGDVNDLRTARKLAAELHGGRKLDAVLRKKQRKRMTDFRKLWKAEFSAGDTKRWIASLKEPPRKPAARSNSAAGTKQMAAATRVAGSS